MTKQQALDIIKLLSALEAWSFCSATRMPDYLLEDISKTMELLSQEVLK